jgi:hypothetical protein
MRKSRIFGLDFKSLIFSSYWLVKNDLPELLSANEFSEAIEAVCADKGYNLKASDLDIVEAMPFILFLIDELGLIAEVEQKYLSTPPDNDLLNAGVKDLDEIGALNVVDSLANGNILEWDRIKKLSYNTVFDKLRKNTVEGKIQKKYNKILLDKEKAKNRIK